MTSKRTYGVLSFLLSVLALVLVLFTGEAGALSNHVHPIPPVSFNRIVYPLFDCHDEVDEYTVEFEVEDHDWYQNSAPAELLMDGILEVQFQVLVDSEWVTKATARNDFPYEEVFSGELPRRRRRLLLYALRKFSSLRPAQIARRHSRSPAAVTLAVRDLDAEAEYNEELAWGIGRVKKGLLRKTKN